MFVSGHISKDRIVSPLVSNRTFETRLSSLCSVRNIFSVSQLNGANAPLDIWRGVQKIRTTRSNRCIALVRGEAMQSLDRCFRTFVYDSKSVSYTHLRAHETPEHLACLLLVENKKLITF